MPKDTPKEIPRLPLDGTGTDGSWFATVLQRGPWSLRRDDAEQSWTLYFRDSTDDEEPLSFAVPNILDEEIDTLRALLVAWRIVDGDGQQ